MSRSPRYPAFLLALAAALPSLAQQPMQLTLAQAQQIAINNNPRYASSKFTAAAAYQVPREYAANLKPNLFGSLTAVGADNGTRLAAGFLNNPLVFSRTAGGLTATQLVTDFGRTRNLVGSAKLQAQAQDQNSENTRAEILLVTGRAYFSVLRAQAVLNVAAQTVAARQLVVDQVTALAQSKLRSGLDVSFANVNLAEAKLLQIQAQNDFKSAETELATAMGLPNETNFAVSEEPMPSPLPTTVNPLLAEAIQNRPDLKDLQLEQSAAEQFTKAEHALRYPSVGLIGMVGGVPEAVSQVPNHYGAIGLNVNIPILNGGLFKARETEAELKAKAARQDLSDLANRVTRDVRDAYLNALTAYDRITLTQQLLQQAQLGYNLAQSRYELGLSSIVELSQAQLNLTSAQIANTSAKYDYQNQRVVVDYQIGVLR